MSDISSEITTTELTSVDASEKVATAGTKGRASKEKKSRWRDIERITRKLRLLRDLREINPKFDPYSSDEFMQFQMLLRILSLYRKTAVRRFFYALGLMGNLQPEV